MSAGTLGWPTLLLGFLLLIAPGCREVERPDILDASWAGYRARFIEADGRVVRPEHDHNTVSEGQAYALLRAAWMDDQPTFDRVWRWTRQHLYGAAATPPGLMAWRWSPATGIADPQAATDADLDLALALLEAAGRWERPTDDAAPPYAEAARGALQSILSAALVTDDNGRHLLLPGAWADQRRDGRGVVLNPSYLAPAWYRAFHHATGDARWLDLVDDAYLVLDAVTTPRSPHAPDWVRWWSSGRWVPEGDDPRSGWDAVRIPWRIATDALWFAEPRASRWMEQTLGPVIRARLDAGAPLPVEWSLAGQPLGTEDHPLSLSLFWFAATRDDRDRLIERLEPRLLWDGDYAFFGEPDRYYVNSLAYLPYLARAGRYRAPRPSRP